jgi:hypothetical protein
MRGIETTAVFRGLDPSHPPRQALYAVHGDLLRHIDLLQHVNIVIKHGVRYKQPGS